MSAVFETHEHARRAAALFIERMRENRATWQQDMRHMVSMPITVKDDRDVPLTGGNALLLLQAMQDRQLRDPRWLTKQQIDGMRGVLPENVEPVEVQYLRAIGEDGAMLANPQVVTFELFNAETVDGLSPWTGQRKEWSLEVLAERLLPRFGVRIVHDQTDRAFVTQEDRTLHMPPPSAFPSLGDYVGVAVHELSHTTGEALGREVQGVVGDVSFAREELRAELASMHLSIALGIPHDVARHKEFVGQWEALLSNDPGEIFRAASDAEKIAALVMWHVKSMEREMAVEQGQTTGNDLSGVRDEGVEADGGLSEQMAEGEEVEDKRDAPVEGEGKRPSTAAERRKAFMRRKYAEHAQKLFETRQCVLAVPYEDRKAAMELGAVFLDTKKLYFVPAGVDMEPLKRWSVKEGQGAASNAHIPSESEIITAFEKEMQALGLVIDAKKGTIADNKWHYVEVAGHKKGQKPGAYILNPAGGRDGVPSGVVMNHLTGQSVSWKMDIPGLTPERLARMRAEAQRREEEAARELAESYEAASVLATEIWNATASAPHGYCTLKGIQGHGIRVATGAFLLKGDAFRGESGKSIIRSNNLYALLPLMDLDGKIWGLQAISEDGKTKAFMTGARKKGLFCVIDENGVGYKLPTKGPLVFGEGFATKASMNEALNCPCVVCFDAGNMETVAKEIGPKLSRDVVKIIGADNDQFFMERAFGMLAKIGVVAHGEGETVRILTALGKAREVPLGQVIADGEWHLSGRGRYRMKLEPDAGMPECVGSVVVDVIDAEGHKETMRAGNRGMAAGYVAQMAMPGSAIVTPDFSIAGGLGGRPTDWNDLAVRGADVRRQVVNQLQAQGIHLSFEREVSLRQPARETARECALSR